MFDAHSIVQMKKWTRFRDLGFGRSFNDSAIHSVQVKDRSQLAIEVNILSRVYQGGFKSDLLKRNSQVARPTADAA